MSMRHGKVIVRLLDDDRAKIMAWKKDTKRLARRFDRMFFQMIGRTFCRMFYRMACGSDTMTEELLVEDGGSVAACQTVD